MSSNYSSIQYRGDNADEIGRFCEGRYYHVLPDGSMFIAGKNSLINIERGDHVVRLGPGEYLILGPEGSIPA